MTATLAAPMGFLTDLVADVRRALDAHPLDEGALLARASARPPARDFTGALRARTPALIAEVKRASPSAGEIAPEGGGAQQQDGRRYDGGGRADSHGCPRIDGSSICVRRTRMFLYLR